MRGRVSVGREAGAAPATYSAITRAPLGVPQHGVRLERRRLEDQPHPLAVRRVGVGGELVEARARARCTASWSGRSSGGSREDRAEAVEGAVELAPRDVVLGLEVAEQRASADPDLGGDVVERGRLEAALGEEPEGGLLDLRVAGRLGPADDCVGMARVELRLISILAIECHYCGRHHIPTEEAAMNPGARHQTVDAGRRPPRT